MAQRIKDFADGSFLEYNQGNFDEWCVYLTRPGQPAYPPKDRDYFTRLKHYAAKHGSGTLYNDLVSIYDMTGKEVDDKVLEHIDSVTAKYSPDYVDVAIDFTVIYLGMIAEENRAYTKLGKRIKRLGLHQLLLEGMSAREAADFSRGKGWRFIADECKKRGF